MTYNKIWIIGIFTLANLAPLFYVTAAHAQFVSPAPQDATDTQGQGISPNAQSSEPVDTSNQPPSLPPPTIDQNTTSTAPVDIPQITTPQDQATLSSLSQGLGALQGALDAPPPPNTPPPEDNTQPQPSQNTATYDQPAPVPNDTPADNSSATDTDDGPSPMAQALGAVIGGLASQEIERSAPAAAPTYTAPSATLTPWSPSVYCHETNYAGCH